MEPQVETRTVHVSQESTPKQSISCTILPLNALFVSTLKTNGRFDNFRRLLMSDAATAIVHAKLTEAHSVHDPRRHPPEHVYCTDCPHQFQLYRRKVKTVASSPTERSSPAEGQETVWDELVINLSNSVHEMYAEWDMGWGVSVSYLEIASVFSFK